MKTTFPCLLLTGLVLLAGCGGSDSGGDAQTMAERQAAANQVAMEKLKAKIAAQQKELEAQKKKSEASAERAAAASVGKGEVDTYLAGLPGQAGLVVSSKGGDGPRVSGGDLESGFAWSTIKVPLAERVLQDFGGPGEINSAQAGEINRAITISDNDAAAALFSDLEMEHGGLKKASLAVGETLQEAGDFTTEISTEGRDSFSTYGQTEWSLEAQNRYMSALAGGCLADESITDYLLDQMSMTGGEDSFGIGAVGVPAKWKGGWGPGTDGKYLVRQMGVMTVEGKDMVVSLAAIPDDGTFESGQAMATEMATWAADNLGDDIFAKVPCGPVAAPNP